MPHLKTGNQFYTLTTPGTSPLTLDDAKDWMKVDVTTDDALIQSLIDAATEWGQKYTTRDFSANTWTMLDDFFTDPIELRRSPVASITSVKHLVSDVLTTVSADVYYLKKKTQFSEILTNTDESWPTNTDDREQAIEVVFVSGPVACQDQVITALARHVAFMYQNRGDCECAATQVEDAAGASGAKQLYDLLRIPRI